MNQEQLVTFCKEIIKLKDQLKCPICLDIIEETADLQCNHRLCNDCYSRQKDNSNECPLCKTAIARRSLVYKDEFANMLGTFVSKICNKIETAQKLTIEEIIHHDDIEEPLIGRTTKHTITHLLEDKPSPTFINTSLPKKRVYKPLVKDCSTNKSTVVHDGPSTSCSQGDPFDKLIKKPQEWRFNKKNSRIKYTNRKKDKQEGEDYKILDFQNNDTKNAVIQWLDDNRNKFNRLTQTQGCVEDSEEFTEVFSIDLPSVSQVNRKIIKNIDIASKKPDKQNKNDFKMKKNEKYRARSLDIDVNKLEKDASRLSDFGLVENYNIEESNTEDILKKAEENVLTELIEDVYLNKLENELQRSSEKIETELPKAELNNKENENLTTQSSASGWKRIENISKTLRKKGKSPKKLNITLQSSQNTNLGKVLKVHLKNDDLHGKDVNLVPNNIEMEDELEPKIGIITDKQDLLNVSLKQAVDIQEIKDADIHSGNLSQERKTLINTKNQEQKVQVLSNVIIHREDPEGVKIDLYSVPTQKLDISNEHRDEKTPDRSNTKMEVSQSSDSNVSISELSSFSDVMKNLKNNLEQCLKNANQSKNFTKRHIESIKNHLEKLNDFYSGSQQNKLTTDTGIQTDNFKCQECSSTINNKECLKINNTTDTGIQTDDFKCLECVSRINIATDTGIQTDDFKCQECVSKTNIATDAAGIQTDDFKCQECVSRTNIAIDTGIQTDDIKCQECVSRINNKECLTIDKEARRGIDISTHYSLQDMESQCNITDLLVPDCSQNLHLEQTNKLEDKQLKQMSGVGAKSKKTQNDNFENYFSTLDDKELGKISVEGVQSLKKTQNDDFADSLDLLNFETQALEKQYLLNKQAKSSSPDKPIVITDEIDQVDQIDQNAIPSSAKNDPNELICSLKSDCLRKDVGTKRALSDSDSSDIVVAKKRCNRFIREDLSIEFDASEKPNFDKTEGIVAGLSLESDEENDEEYLDNILKKYNGPAASKTADQQADEDCDDIVAQVRQNVENLKRKSNDSAKSSYKTASPHSRNSLDDDDNNFLLDNHNLSKLDNDIKSHTELKHDSCDVITETENFEPCLKKPKLKRLNAAFDKGECPKISMSQESHPLSPIKNNKGTFCPELEDSLDDVDFENILMEEKVKKKSECMDTAVGKSNEDDLFSDEDVVETTPQKSKSIIDKRSPTNNISIKLSSLFPVQDDADNTFDYCSPLLPPPGFQDKNDDNVPFDIILYDYNRTPEDITIINVEPNEVKEVKTATVMLEKRLENTQSRMTPVNIQVKKMQHSTPYSQQNTDASTLALSPIVLEKNLFARANESPNTIISISSQDTPRKRSSILTSDPKQKSILNYIKTPAASQPKQKPCIACTRLTKEQTQSISLLTNKKLATYSAKFNDFVTHMVVSVDENRKIKDYTMKFVSAIASGIWVVGFEWVLECLKNNAIVPEEPYEALDDSGNSGPKIARLIRQQNPLLKGYEFYCVRSLYSITVEEVEDIITKLGGTTVRNLESLTENKGKIKLIITEGRSTQDFEVYEKWLETYKIVTVDIEWLSRSVGRYQILSVRPYIWCSDDRLEELGYPPYLIETISSSSSLSEQM